MNTEPAVEELSYGAPRLLQADGPRSAPFGAKALPEPLMMPAYGGACLSSLVPALLAAPKERPDWLPAPLRAASQVVLLVVDGLGWLQLQSRAHLAPAMAAFGRRADHFGSPDDDGNSANLARSRNDTC